MRDDIRVAETRSELEALEVVVTVLTGGARQVADRFTKPDDDWQTVWLLIDATGRGTVYAGDTDGLEEVAASYANRAVAIGVVNSSWLVEAHGMTRERAQEVLAQVKAQGGSTEGIPERVERLVITVHTASLSRMYAMPINRSDSMPPTLGALEALELLGGVRGGLSETLRQALCKPF